MADDLPPGLSRTAPGGARASDLPLGLSREPPQPKQDYGSVSLAAQTLYDMAKTPEEKRRALEHSYGPGSVKQDESGLYVEDPSGKRLSPEKGGYLTRVPAAIMAEAAPTIGGVVGGGAGAVLGLESGPGAVATGLAGAGAGTAAGQAFNDMILSTMGIFSRDTKDELSELGTAAAFGAAGEGVGRLVGRGVAMATQENGLLRERAKKYLGFEAEKAATLLPLAEKGVNVPIEAYSENAPMLSFMRAYAKKYGYDPVAKTARGYYEGEAGKVLKKLGLTPDQIGNLTKAETGVSFEPTGEALMKRAREQVAEKYGILEKTLTEARQGLASGAEAAKAAHEAEVSRISGAVEEYTKAAASALDAGYKDLRRTAISMFDRAKVGKAPGDLARAYADKLQSLRLADMAVSRAEYEAADAAAAGQSISVAPLLDTARTFLSELPEEIKANQPMLVRQIASLESGTLSFGEARQLRTLLRDMVDYGRLEPAFKDGPYKKLASELNGLIHAPDNAPRVKEAVKLLDSADANYKARMARYADERVQFIVDQTKAGFAPSPDVIARQVLEPGHAERAKDLFEIAGPGLKSATIAADVGRMLEDSKTLVPGQIDAKAFIRQVMDRYRSGVLDLYPKEIRDTLLEQARRAEAFNSIGSANMSVLKGDTFTSALRRAQDAMERQAALAKINPVETLSTEMKNLEATYAQSKAALTQELAQDPLAFLTKPTMGADEAAKRIVFDSDLLRAALLKFDPASPEIAMLRQTAARNLFQTSLEDTWKISRAISGGGSDTGKGIAKETLERLFPNGLDRDVLKLTKQMSLMFGGKSDMAANLSAGATVTNPGRVFGGRMARALDAMPKWAQRGIVSPFLEAFSKVTSDPRVLKWLAENIDKSPEQRAAIQAAIRDTVAMGGDIGTALSALAYGAATTPPDPLLTETAPAKASSWRDRLGAKR